MKTKRWDKTSNSAQICLYPCATSLYASTWMFLSHFVIWTFVTYIYLFKKNAKKTNKQNMWISFIVASESVKFNRASTKAIKKGLRVRFQTGRLRPYSVLYNSCFLSTELLWNLHIGSHTTTHNFTSKQIFQIGGAFRKAWLPGKASPFIGLTTNAHTYIHLRTLISVSAHSFLPMVYTPKMLTDTFEWK